MRRKFSLVFPLILFAILGGFLMMINGVLVFPLRHAFYITASMTGVMTGSYFFFTMFAQMSLNQLQRGHDPKWMMVMLTMIAAFGMVIFATASSVFGLTLGRAVMGVGFCGSVFVAFSIFSKEFDVKYRPHFFSALMIASSIGAILATYPTYLGGKHMGWQALLFMLALISVILGIFIIFFMPKIGIEDEEHSNLVEIESLKKIIKAYQFQKIALPLSLGMGTFLAMQSLWMTPWLVQGNHFTFDRAVLYLCLSAIGMLVGVLQGSLWTNLKTIYVRHALFILALVLIATSSASQYPLFWLLFGYLMQFTHFAFKQVGSGLAMVALHSLILGMTFVMQVVIGCVIDIWQRNLHEHYPPIAFKAAFMVAVFINAIGWLISICMKKETTYS